MITLAVELSTLSNGQNPKIYIHIKKIMLCPEDM